MVDNEVVDNEIVDDKVVDNEIVDDKVVVNEMVDNKVVDNEVVDNKVVGNKNFNISTSSAQLTADALSDAEPTKITKLSINYSKVTKDMDINILKSTI